MLNHHSGRIGIEALRMFMRDLLTAVGLDEDSASTVAEVHLESDLRGVHVQGFNHLVNSHLQYYMQGKADPNGKPVIVKEGPSFALIDGNSGPGPLAALFACDVATTKAKGSGTAIVGVNNSHDLFHAGLYAEKIARADLVGMLFSDDAVPVVHPLGGTEPIIGSNPLACAVPSSGDPFLTDFTPCMTLPTYVRYTQRYDAELPRGVASDADGNPTVDPSKVCTGLTHSSNMGAINPGGSKGFGMLLMIDFLSGALVGADMGMDHITKADAKKGHLLVAIDPDLFGSAAAFKAAVSKRMDDIRSSNRAPGVEAIRMPGEGSFERRKRALRDGAVSIDRLCWKDAVKLSQDLGVKAPRLD